MTATATPPTTDPPADESPMRLGWLAIPAILLVMVLVGIAVSTESRDEFEERAEEAGQGEGEQQGQGQGGEQGQQGQSGEQGQQGQGQQGQQGQGGEQGQQGQGQQGEGQQGQGQEQGDGQQGQGQRGQGQSGQPGQDIGDGDGQVIIQTEDGEIVVELDENGNPVRVVPSDSVGPSDPGRVFAPDPDGGFIGARVTEDGRLEPVERDDLQGDDYLFRPSPDGGLDITRPDGSRVELEPTAEGELEGTEISNDGTAQPITADDGEIVIDTGGEFSDQFGPGFDVDPTTEPIVIETETGPVRIDLEETGDLVANQPRDNAAVVLDPDELSAIRINEDGQPEIVPLDEINPDEDTLLVPTEEGFDLVRPDGSRVEFRPDGDNDGLTATEVTPDGEETELTPNPDGSVTLDDGTTVGPIDVAEDGGMIENILDQGSDLPWPWVFGAIGLLALLSIGTAFYLHRNRPEDQFDYTELATQGVPVDRFEEFLRMLAADPDPTRSIRLAFYAVERGMSGLPTRRANETPFEWHSRVEKTRPDLAEVLGPICDLFARARFAPGQATVEDRDLMISLLRQLNNVANSAASGAKLAAV